MIFNSKILSGYIKKGKKRITLLPELRLSFFDSGDEHVSYTSSR